jgi:hypothetical protein
MTKLLIAGPRERQSCYSAQAQDAMTSTATACGRDERGDDQFIAATEAEQQSGDVVFSHRADWRP